MNTKQVDKFTRRRADGADPRDVAGRRLLRRMLAAGMSRYEPDPLEALPSCDLR